MSYRRDRGTMINPIWLIMGVNLLVLIARYINENQIDMHMGLAGITFTHQPWNLLTYMFVHAGILHYFFNMLTLYFFGNYVLSLLGEGRFLLIYFIGGILGGVFFILLAPSNHMVVGASGAIFALGGVLAVMRPNIKVITLPIPVPLPLWIAIMLSFLVLSFLPGVAWQGHLGGLVCGLLMGSYFRQRERRRRPW
jgi:uncharacterized protein